MPVFNGQNEAIGKIADLIMDRQAGIATAIISVGGYLGVSERLVQVQLDVLRFPHSADTPNSPYPEKAILNTTKEVLLGLPAFKY